MTRTPICIFCAGSGAVFHGDTHDVYEVECPVCKGVPAAPKFKLEVWFLFNPRTGDMDFTNLRFDKSPVFPLPAPASPWVWTSATLTSEKP